MECDHPHYFYDGMDGSTENFFTSTAPSEDIWKKFELLPTPPVSPSRTLSMGRMIFAYPTERGAWLAEDCLPFKIDPLDVFGNMGSVVIKDCMWSSGFATTRVTPCAEAHPNELILPRIQSTRGTDAQTTRCVNPTAVLNLPASHQPKKQTTASSGSESHTDLSDDDDDDDEIDVVTVEKQMKRQTRTPITIAVSADPHGPCKKHFHVSLHRQQHNYAAPSPDSDDELENDDDDFFSEQTQLDHAFSAPSSSSSSPASSDSEDSTEQRRNFLERKRRDDLRSRFQLLRKEVPGLSNGAKTSKVAILTRATEYLLQLQAHEKWQGQERKKLQARRRQLLRKISTLKTL